MSHGRDNPEKPIPNTNLTRSQMLELMANVQLSGAAIAAVVEGKPSEATVLGFTDQSQETLIAADSKFKVASLSKPLFAYIILQLIQSSAFSRSGESAESGLDRPLHEIADFGPPNIRNHPYYQLVTARMVLAHTTGIPQGPGSSDFQFEPGTEHLYSGVAIGYLQEIIQEMLRGNCDLISLSAPPTLETLSTLAIKSNAAYVRCDNKLFYVNKENNEITEIPFSKKEGIEFDKLLNPTSIAKTLSAAEIETITRITHHKHCKTLENIAKEFVFNPLQMNHSSFIVDESKPAVMHAAYTLSTTASDYARFVAAWMRDETLQHAFHSEISMTKDAWAAQEGLTQAELKKVAWGLGWGLQLTSQGEVTRAYHTGDSGKWRAVVVMNPEKKSALIYFTNAETGLMLTPKLLPPHLNLDDALKYLFKKWGFAQNFAEGWEQKQAEAIAVIRTKHELHLQVDLNKNLGTLTLKCDTNLLKEYVVIIKNEFEAFKMQHGMKDNEAAFKAKTDAQGNIQSLTINIPNRKLLQKFFAELDAKALLATPANKREGPLTTDEMASSAFGQGSKTAGGRSSYPPAFFSASSAQKSYSKKTRDNPSKTPTFKKV